MKKTKKTMAAMALVLSSAMLMAACGSSDDSKPKETQSGSEPSQTEAPADTEAPSGGDDTDVVDLNSMSLDEIIAQAKEEGTIESVGMPDSWANWGNAWAAIEAEYGITHNDADMSSAEEINMFKTEGEKGTKDIGDVGQAFGPQAEAEGVTLNYKTSYWDSIPDYAKGDEGSWIMCYTGATCFLTNTDLVPNAPKTWQDIKDGDYKVSIGDITGGNAQAAIIASAYAFGGGMDNLDPAFEFWTEMAEAGRINTLDILKQNFETGEVECGVIWSFTGLPYRDTIEKYKLEANIPTDGAIKSGYASIINKYAPHPAAAALAREYFLSDAGQENLAKAGAIPIRTDYVVPEEVQEATFSADSYKDAIAIEDTDAYSKVCEEVVARWQEEIIPLLVQ